MKNTNKIMYIIIIIINRFIKYSFISVYNFKFKKIQKYKLSMDEFEISNQSV